MKAHETLTFYPHWCFDCMFSFIGDKETQPCPRCKSENVINYKRKIYKDIKNELQKSMRK